MVIGSLASTFLGWRRGVRIPRAPLEDRPANGASDYLLCHLTGISRWIGVLEVVSEPFNCGSVAVNRQGARIGKGGGFSDLEVAFLVEAGVIRRETVLATTVHPLQLVDEPLPETIHDFRADLIVTPHRPPGILWEHLQQDKIAEVPILAALAARR